MLQLSTSSWPPCNKRTGAAPQDRAAAAGGATAPTHVAGDALLWELARKRPDRVQYLAICEGASSLFRQQHGQARRVLRQPARAHVGAASLSAPGCRRLWTR